MKLPCKYCGSIDTAANRRRLWDLYYRLDDGGRKYIEPLVYTAEDLWEDRYDDDGIDAVKLSMEKNMAERGLCPECGLPDLRGTTEEDFMSLEDARSLHDMYAEMRAEQRMGA